MSMLARQQTQRAAVWQGAKVKPIGALVMASFADLHAPIEKVRDALKLAGLEDSVSIEPPNMTDALALIMQNVDTVFAQDVLDDRYKQGDVESLTWRAKKVGRGEYVIHRVALLPADRGRLKQPNVLRVWITWESWNRPLLHVQVLDASVFEKQDAEARIAKLLEDWTQAVNGQRVRTAWLELLRRLLAVPYMPRGIGGLSFVPDDGAEIVQRFASFMAELEPYRITQFDFAIRSIPVWDTDEVRAALMKDVEDEVNNRLDELAEKVARDVLDAEDAKRLEKVLERRVQAREKILGMKATYEDLLRAKLVLRARVADRKVLKAAEKKIETKASTERARALFRSLLSQEATP